jgi:Uma2 family endonuclease
MATAGTLRMTLEQYKALPEGPPHFEFEEGELVPMTSPIPEHQDAVDAVKEPLRHFVQQQHLGRVFREVDVYLPDGRVYIPDLSFLATDRLHLLSPEDRKIHGVPDVVVEVTSSEPERDRVDKFRVYFDNGVPWYWIVDSATLAIEEYHFTPQGYLRTASIAPGEEFHPQRFAGFKINLAALLGSSSPSG